ncbi:hypothetical protein D3C73_1105830 [compost metagenome]
MGKAIAPGPPIYTLNTSENSNASSGIPARSCQLICIRNSCLRRGAASSTGNNSRLVENCSLNQANQAITAVLLYRLSLRSIDKVDATAALLRLAVNI